MHAVRVTRTFLLTPCSLNSNVSDMPLTVETMRSHATVRSHAPSAVEILELADWVEANAARWWRGEDARDLVDAAIDWLSAGDERRARRDLVRAAERLS